MNKDGIIFILLSLLLTNYVFCQDVNQMPSMEEAMKSKSLAKNAEYFSLGLENKYNDLFFTLLFHLHQEAL